MITKDQAKEFALLLSVGVPAGKAVEYFAESSDPVELGLLLNQFQKSKLVASALIELQGGKDWTRMNLDEAVDTALELHRRGLAYYLYSTNYSEANSAEKQKLDTARQALESYRAGTAGKGDALTQFIEEFRKTQKTLTPKVEVAH